MKSSNILIVVFPTKMIVPSISQTSFFGTHPFSNKIHYASLLHFFFFCVLGMNE